MLTRFISDESYNPVNLEYYPDDNVKINSLTVGVDGNLDYTIIQSLSTIKDLKINNYTLAFLTGNEQISNFIYLEENNEIKNKMCDLYWDNDGIANYWKFETDNITVSTIPIDYEDKNIFEIEFFKNDKCKIYYQKENIFYVLAYSLSLSSIKMVPLTADNIFQYSTEFSYIEKNNKILFFVVDESHQYALKKYNSGLLITETDTFDDRHLFHIDYMKNFNPITLSNDWVSYQNDFYKNNININLTKSHTELNNNFLFSTTINSIVSSIPINILTLKNQLNQENNQSRGNVFLNENETNLKEYESLFLGGYRETGFDKINIGYTAYSTPFVFKSGKTTYFHVPHNIYPNEKLNINSSKLAESGSVGGSCPLNSDKVWKKLKNYKETSPYSKPQEENTGQWLCTWLSAGNPNNRPVWMDRYYVPSKITPYMALSATETDVIYKNSFDCYNLKENISDVESSLTFEKGSYYAYMHMGKNDYTNLIKSFDSKIFYRELEEYQNTKFLDLVPIDGEYSFDGQNYGYIDSNKNYEYNNVTFSFFANKEKWNNPTGNLIFGNYIKDGFGFFNYNFNTPYQIFKIDSQLIPEHYGDLQVLNNNFEEIYRLSTKNLTLSPIRGISRQSGFENIHLITSDFKIIEMDLKGTIVDSNSAIKELFNLKDTDDVISVTNDKNNCYVNTPSGVAVFSLLTNQVSSINITATITTSESANSYLLFDPKGVLYNVFGKQPIYRNDNIYTFAKNNFFVFSTASQTLTTYIQTASSINCYNIDKKGEINIVSNDKLYIYKNRDLLKTITLSAVNTYPLSANNFSICEKFEYGWLKNYKQIYCIDDKNYYHIIQIDENDNQKIISLNNKYIPIQNNIDFTGYNFNRAYLTPAYSDTTYNFKIKLLNQLDLEDIIILDFIIDSKDLSTGVRHFLFTIDCYQGKADFYLDSQLYKSINFPPKKYCFSKVFNGRIYYGSNPFFNGILASENFKDISDFTYKDMTFFNNYIINKAIDKTEVSYFYNEYYPPLDIEYNMPSGTRSFIDTIDKTFNFNTPMYKSGVFDLKILNSGIKYDGLKEDIKNYIKDRILDFIPAYTKLNNLEWLDITSVPIIVEGDYNVSNTLTDI